MELFIGIGIAWIVGMAGYTILSTKTPKGKHRCNLKKEIIQFKKVNSQISDSIKK
jgi:hypothetical protein